jgi:hypothetical protein
VITIVDGILEQFSARREQPKIHTPRVDPNPFHFGTESASVFPHPFQNVVVKGQDVPIQGLANLYGFVGKARNLFEGKSAILESSHDGTPAFGPQVKSEKSMEAHRRSDLLTYSDPP